jgi:hypothetical protein
MVAWKTDPSHFARHGYVRIPGALPPEFVARTQEAVWAELQRLADCSPEKPNTWRLSGVVINRRTLDKIVGVEIGPCLTEAVDELLGEGRWRPLQTLGGLLLTMPDGSPETWSIPSTGWHVDNDPRRYPERIDELMLFTFYSSVRPQGGGTLILSGSPQLLECCRAAHDGNDTAFPARLIGRLPDWHPRLAELIGKEPERRDIVEEWVDRVVEVDGVPLRIVELTGEPGDAVLCHPLMLHAISRNCLTVPRIMRRTNIRRAR